MAKTRVIAIDGEAASGKSTVGSLLAQRLGCLYFDTGVMYRAVTWAALDQQIDPDDEIAVTEVAQTLDIKVVPPTKDDGRQYTVLADGQDVTWAIRQPPVDAAVSPVSAYPGVRRALTAQQRFIASEQDVVMVGRDIGTVVMPDADLKLYMKASVTERARRRFYESQARGENPDYDEVLASMRRRDQVDSERDLAPLRPAEDAVLIDTDGLDVQAVLDTILPLLRRHQVLEEA